MDQHFYDFSEDTDLLHKLTSFLDEISGKSMRKWVECISKVVQRRLDNDEAVKEIVFDFDRSPPQIETHIKNPQDDWPELLTYHPIEIARQLTLIEFQYYKAVKPSELVDLAWISQDKDKRSPNLLRMVRHTTNFTRYLEKTILETDHAEERVAVIRRVLEVMLVLQEHNNFNGVLAITSALNSSAVHRLGSTKDKLESHFLKALEDATSLVADHFKQYLEKLRSINPPCVPFFGQYQTNILFLEEGNPDFLHNSDLINFSKRRKVAEIISEIQQYQNQPYCLSPYPKLRQFLEDLDPFPGLNEKEVSGDACLCSLYFYQKHFLVTDQRLPVVPLRGDRAPQLGHPQAAQLRAAVAGPQPQVARDPAEGPAREEPPQPAAQDREPQQGGRVAAGQPQLRLPGGGVQAVPRQHPRHPQLPDQPQGERGGGGAARGGQDPRHPPARARRHHRRPRLLLGQAAAAAAQADPAPAAAGQLAPAAHPAATGGRAPGGALGQPPVPAGVAAAADGPGVPAAVPPALAGVRPQRAAPPQRERLGAGPLRAAVARHVRVPGGDLAVPAALLLAALRLVAARGAPSSQRPGSAVRRPGNRISLHVRRAHARARPRQQHRVPAAAAAPHPDHLHPAVNREGEEQSPAWTRVIVKCCLQLYWNLLNQIFITRTWSKSDYRTMYVTVHTKNI